MKPNLGTAITGVCALAMGLLVFTLLLAKPTNVVAQENDSATDKTGLKIGSKAPELSLKDQFG